MDYNNLVNSALGSAVAEIITLPVCTLKTNYQNTSSTSIISTAKEMYKSRGLRSFYQASFPAIFSQMISTSSKWVIYRHLEDQHYQYSNSIFNGVISGISSSLVTHPIDTIKIHLQMRKPFVPELKTHGIRLFYRGYSKSFSKVCVGSACFFPLNDYCNKRFDNPVLASFFSGLLSTLIIHPLDYLKTRHIYGQTLYQDLNPSFYYKGLSLNLLRTVPHFTIMMSTIAYLSKNPLFKINNCNINT